MSNDIREGADLSLIRQRYESEMQVTRSNGQKFASGSEAHNYRVKSVPLYTADGTPANVWGNQREDNGIIIGVTSDRYGIVQNQAFADAIEDGFRSNGLEPTSRDAFTTRWGARSYIEYNFSTRTAEVTKGDVVALRVIARNSFDGTSRSSFSVGAVRLVCLNGMTSFREDLSLSVVHRSTANANYVRGVISQAMDEWHKLNEAWSGLAGVPITQQQGYNIISTLSERGVYSERLKKAVTNVWDTPSYREDNERNLWNLYNAHTQVLTHNYDADKFEMTSRTSHNVFRSLRDASINEHTLVSLANPEGSQQNN